MVTAGLAGRSASAAAPPLRTGGQITCEHTRQSGFFGGLSEGRTFYLSQTKEMPCSLPRDEGRFLSLFDGGAENSPSASHVIVLFSVHPSTTWRHRVLS